MDKYINELGDLINKCQNCIDKKGFKEVKKYYNYGEFEVALEGLIIELIAAKKYPEEFNPEEWKKIAIDFELNNETVLDDNSWENFLNWCNEYTANSE